jgi:7-keto-8-aminopelargonate synthetase-like enzyme
MDEEHATGWFGGRGRGVVEVSGASGGGDTGSFWENTCEVRFKG